MHVVTGGAGFVGSHLVKALNERGVTDVLVVDDLTLGTKCQNLSGCQLADYLDKDEFLRAVEGGLLRSVKAVYHQGACTDTMELDGRRLMADNFAYSKVLLEHALEAKVPLVYASSAAVYGAEATFRESPENERPINPYGFSKLVFDQYVRRRLPQARSTVVGLRYFNVYGPNEHHKGRMASMVYQTWRQLAETGRVRLFEGTGGYEDGEQRRDFVFVEDVVAVNLHFGEGAPRQGIFNVGTGASRTFNEVAGSLIRLRGAGAVDYVPIPAALAPKYQSFTEADTTGLRGAGFARAFTPLEEGVRRCLEQWEGRPAPVPE